MMLVMEGRRYKLWCHLKMEMVVSEFFMYEELYEKVGEVRRVSDGSVLVFEEVGYS